MTLIELQKVLGDRINVTLSDMTPEQKKIEKTALIGWLETDPADIAEMVCA